MIITICGSMLFMPQMYAAAEQLRVMGHDVLLPVDQEAEGKAVGSTTPEEKNFFLKAHFDKIERSDAVLIMNEAKRGVEGYIGGNTLCEMAVAFVQNKPIYVMHDLPQAGELSYLLEVQGMMPIILNGNLSQLKVAA